MIENSIVTPIWWPYELSIQTFKGNFPEQLCKEIHEFLSIENNRYRFIEYIIDQASEPNINRRWEHIRKRNLDIYFSLFGIKDKMYTREICNKFNVNRERVRQIMSKMTRQLFHYAFTFLDKKFTLAPKHMPYLKQCISESISKSPLPV